MSEDASKENQPIFVPPVSSFTGPVGELIAQRMLSPPPRPGLLAVLDHFEIVRVVGAGGMGIVLLARDLATGREAAIKLVKSDLVTNQHAVHRFLKETGHLKRLRHTNIVPVEEISDRPEGPYFVMPYFEKGSLAGRIKPGRPMDTESILDIAIQVAEGLSFAHRSGIIHRDLKPANILLGANGSVCLGDFGLARTVFNDTIVDVESHQLEGTAPYVSPAIAAGDAEDTRCDIYSFGALLYEMLTGLPPYQGRGTKEILDQILAGPPKPIMSVNPAADRGLVAVAEGCMARELRDRYADMRDVLKDLRRVQQHEPPVGPRAGAQGWRVPKAVVVAVCLLVTVLIASAAMIFLREHPEPAVNPTPTNSVIANPTTNAPVVLANPTPASITPTNPIVPPVTNAPTPTPVVVATNPVTVPSPPVVQPSPQLKPMRKSVNDIVKLTTNGIPENLISAFVKDYPPDPPLSSAEMDYLKANGVAQNILNILPQSKPASVAPVVPVNPLPPASPTAEAHALVKSAYEKYTLHEDQQAIVYCNRALQLDPEYPEALCVKAISEEALHNTAEAIIGYATFLKLPASGNTEYAAWRAYATSHLRALRGW
jgi:serine/threonine protein kinase